MLVSTLQKTRGLGELPGTLDPALAAVMTRAGISAELEGPDLQEALHQAIALRRCSCTWTKVQAGWVVTLQFPEPRRFFGLTLEEALAWCLAWVMDQEAKNSSLRSVPHVHISDACGSQTVG